MMVDAIDLEGDGKSRARIFMHISIYIECCPHRHTFIASNFFFPRLLQNSRFLFLEKYDFCDFSPIN